MVSASFILHTEVDEMKQAIMNFLREEEGLTTVEYAIAGGLIGLAVVGAFQALGITVGGVITNIDTCVGGGAC
jgi:pilus assembly protein Flp/PilA